MTASATPLLVNSPPCIVFTDWDGTVTLQDSNDAMTDNLGYGYERRRFLNKEILEGRWTFRDAFADMLESIKTPFPECIDYLKKNVQLTPASKRFTTGRPPETFHRCRVLRHDPIIRALLETLVGEEAANTIPIVSNDINFKDDGSWAIQFRDESDFGHDKSRAIRPYAQINAKLAEADKVPLFTAATVFLISLLPKKLISCLPKKEEILSLTVNVKILPTLSLKISKISKLASKNT